MTIWLYSSVQILSSALQPGANGFCYHASEFCSLHFEITGNPCNLIGSQQLACKAGISLFQAPT